MPPKASAVAQVFESKELTNEARAEAKLALAMLCKEEEDEVNLLFVND